MEGFWTVVGPLPLDVARAHANFIVTPSVRKHVTNLARILTAKLPVLLEGPTSSGKTSMVRFLAELTGHECVRINHHEHTDVQEFPEEYF